MLPEIRLSSPQQRASFSVSSRLVSCLVTESLLRAYYLPVDATKPKSQTTGAMVVLSASVFADQPVITRTLRAEDVFAIVPLRRVPILKTGTVHRHGHPIGLVDPLDMLPNIYELEIATENTSLVGIGPLDAFNRSIDNYYSRAIWR